MPLALLLLLSILALAMVNGSVYEKKKIQSVRESVCVLERWGIYIYIYIYIYMVSIDEKCLNTSIEALFTK